jgi:RNA polymerase sigma-70 factor (ECF subfamily)
VRFEELMVPHLDAAYNLARHLVRDPHEADDVVQESFLRALRYFDAFRGANARAWLLAIVRHTAYTRRRRLRMTTLTTEFNEEMHSAVVEDAGPEQDLAKAEAKDTVAVALGTLPAKFREVLVLRELEDLSYEDISRIVRVPVGTVMSRLSRARERLQRALTRDDERAS